MTPEGAPKQFASPEEELHYLRQRIAERERELLVRSPEIDRTDLETVGRQELREYGAFTPQLVLKKTQRLEGEALSATVEQASVAHDKVAEVFEVALRDGIRNALTVLERLDDAFVADEVHRRLIEHIRGGRQVQDLREGVPPWQVMHMTLFEVTLPEVVAEGREQGLADLVGAMEQLFLGLQSIGSRTKYNHFVLELAVAEGSDDIVFYVAVPDGFVDLFEKQTLSLFPHAVITEQAHDYNIFVEGGVAQVSELTLAKHPIYPLRTADDFHADPLAVLLNAFSKIEREGGGAAVQFIVRHPQQPYRKSYEEIVQRVRKGMKPREAIERSTLGGEVMASLGEFIFKKPQKPASDALPELSVDQQALEAMGRKLASPLLEVNVRIAASARTAERAAQIRGEIEATFNQFEAVDGNSVRFVEATRAAHTRAIKAFSFREFQSAHALPLSIAELATLIHFPGNGIGSTPQFKQSRAKTAPAPTEMPTAGTLLGVNAHRGHERAIYVTPEDRLRHLYVIGQTGTGKSVFLKNLILQDIEAGAGVCMIDPHGTDIEDVLGAIPDERLGDVIYFDPARQDRVIGLNMLEFDPARPEQKTFVVNELFSIFQKLYGANPESMGPMFEQYFRNATLLVMEDPESGSTLMDISRVMSDARYRRQKLERATNPVVVQFWREIATKAGGEAALENVVPYIVSKFDVFTANDYMRPIIGQQQSTFNFRQLMDQRKILLVNLSKGRLGEINANLIGMIVVGKLLMAALSRVDDPSRGFPPFYLHIDEFQNVSTNAIASILSEARKYKLGLTVAHQFIAQLDPAIRDAVFGNVGSLAAFRVGSEDAHFLEQQFSPTFAASDLMNVPNYQAYLRVLANGTPTKPFSVGTLPPPTSSPERAQWVIEQSYRTYGRPRAQVEADIAARYQKPPVPPPVPLSP